MIFALALFGATGPLPAQASPAPATVSVELETSEATVGDHIGVRVLVTLEDGVRLDPPQFGPELGPFSVVDGVWSDPETVEGGQRWIWSGAIVAFRTGEFELPGLRVEVHDSEGQTHGAGSDPVPITILSVLDPEAGPAAPPEIADLKPPASLDPDYGPMLTGIGILAALLLGAGLLWLLHRRYAARLAAIPAPEDPFHRTPAHEWVYAELQKLLERRLAEQGQVALFFSELSRILKRYLGGRFRVELMEQTTADVAPRLRQAGAATEATEDVARILGRCDMVKFAKLLPGSEDCRDAIEAAYRIVDATKPKIQAHEPESA
jgi:hypothetical protein